ncbi:MAG: alpha/beta hydrolase [Actinomycetaceae bacterium]|nr:alpha/beta hydrolase [Actinomycetaceae bacterium]MDY5854894.1 alpha/beta hydrolase [Arcanobacterium sp.]
MFITQTSDAVFDAERNLAADIYEPNEPNGAAIILIHGGGWAGGDKSADADLATFYAEAGYLTVVPNYSLTPTAYFPQPNEDIAHAIEWLKASSYEFARDRIAAVGYSVGGTMAAEMAIRLGIPAISLSGMFANDIWLATHPDLEAKPLAEVAKVHPDVVGPAGPVGPVDQFYKWFLLNYFNGDASKAESSSPVYRVNEKTGSMLLVNSYHELTPVSEVTAMQQALADHHVPVWVRLISGTRHAKAYFEDVKADTLRFLADVLDVAEAL